MKKIFVLVAVTIMAVVSVNAQSGYEDTTHEIGVSIGEMSNSKWVSVADFMGTTIFSIGNTSMISELVAVTVFNPSRIKTISIFII